MLHSDGVMSGEWEANKKKRRDLYSWLNPYSLILKNFPGKIFSFEDPTEKDILKSTINSYKNIILELGSGSGKHLIERAKVSPEAAFFGFELRFKRAVRTIQKAEKVGARNVFVLRTDAKEMINYFSNQSISGVYVNFPDPWQKKKQRKNRLLGEEFLQVIYDSLLPGGFFSFKTDHQEYFLSVAEMLRIQNCFKLQEYAEDLYASEYLSSNIKTEFEDLFCSKNLPIHYLKVSKD